MECKIPNNCYLQPKEVVVGDTTMSVLQCVPNMDSGVISVKRLGGMTQLTLMKSKLAEGVNTHDIHEFNVMSGAIPPDEETVEERHDESQRVSIVRAITAIRELVACNEWRAFVTITLSPEKWKDRCNPESLQSTIKNLAMKWKRMQRDKTRPYKDFKYLLIPELHKNGAVHLHGFVNLIPREYYIRYTEADIMSDQPLPQYICDAVKAGREIAHCTAWDELFGYNVIEPIQDLDRAANYATKYVTKDLGKTPFACRYWCSRGLQRGATVGAFQCPVDQSAIAEYENLITPHAVVTPAGKTIHMIYHRPPQSPEDKDTFAGIKTTIDKDSLSTEDTLSLLDQHYPRFTG